MRHPSALPAAAILAGTAIGALSPGASRFWLACATGVCWVVSIVGFVRGRPVLVCAWTTIGFVACGALLGSSATRSAVSPPLRERLDEHGLLSGQAHDRGTLVTLDGLLREDARISETGVALSVAVDRVAIDGRWRGAPGGVLVTVAGAPPSSIVDGWRAGRRIRAPVLLRRPARYLDPGVSDGEAALARRGTALVGSVKSALLVEVVAKGSPISEIAATCRRTVRRAIAHAVGRWSVRSAGIVTAILIGDRAGLDASVDRRLQDAGTYHVIAISGGNIAILAGLLLSALRVLGLARRGWNLVPIVALVGYAYLVGTGASVSRATLMAVVFLIAGVFDLGSAPLNALCVAATVILARAPLAIFDAGFILTFGATLGILTGALFVPQRRPGGWLLHAAWLLFAASLSAELALLPVQAFVFSRVTCAGLVLNFAAIPLMSVAQIAGLVAVAFEPVHAGIAGLAGFAAHLGADGLVESARFVELVPWLVRRVPRPSLVTCAVYYAGVAAWLAADGIRSRTRAAVNPHVVRRIAMLATAGAVVWILAAPSIAPGGGLLRVRFLDVGQGDSALVEFPNGRTLLVDAGGVLPAGSFDIGERVLAPTLWHVGIRRLNYLAVTHGDPDHIGGAPAIVRDFRPVEVWAGVPVPAHRATNELRAEALARGAAWRTLQAGDALTIGDTEVRIWHPPPPDWERQKVRNDDSLVMEVRKGAVSVLLTGDIGRDVEQSLLSNLRSDTIRILKVPHHGSVTSSSGEFITAVRPAVAVFSAGRDNRFGHPAPAVLDRYRDAGVALFRTDLDGAVTLETDGRSVHMTSFNGKKLDLPAR